MLQALLVSDINLYEDGIYWMLYLVCALGLQWNVATTIELYPSSPNTVDQL